MFQPDTTSTEFIKYCPVWPCQTSIALGSGLVGGIIGGLIAGAILVKKYVTGASKAPNR